MKSDTGYSRADVYCSGSGQKTLTAVTENRLVSLDLDYILKRFTLARKQLYVKHTVEDFVF